ncbi:MAG: hypothetical protein JXB08_01675 [Bacilli bacterium]|nr:hypothetical protein [Bacilli bacterium]MBN2877684.1 hypothetical protein [Bacilli bacterium]
MKKIVLVLFLSIGVMISIQSFTVHADTNPIIEDVYSPYFTSSMIPSGYSHIGYMYDYTETSSLKTKTYVDLMVYSKILVRYQAILGTIQVATQFNDDDWSLYMNDGGLLEINNYYHDSFVITKTLGFYLDFTINDLTASYQFLELGHYYEETSSYQGHVVIDYSQVSDPEIVMTIYSLSAKMAEKRTVCTSERSWSWTKFAYIWSSYSCSTGSTQYSTYRLGYDEYFTSVNLPFKSGYYLISKKDGYSFTYFTYY